MNYFELYEIRETLSVDPKLAKVKFLELSRKFHPDFHGNASEETQLEVLESSTANTNAYDTFKNPYKTIEYVLGLHGLLEESYKLDPVFLMEMMEINEQLMELEFDLDRGVWEGIDSNVAQTEQALEAEIEAIRKPYETSEGEKRGEILKKVQEYYFKKKYLLRIRESLNTFASRL